MEKSLMQEANDIGVFSADGRDVYSDALKRVDDAMNNQQTIQIDTRTSKPQHELDEMD